MTPKISAICIFLGLLKLAMSWNPDMPGGIKMKINGQIFSVTTDTCSGGVFFKKPVKIQLFCAHGYFFKRTNGCKMTGTTIVAGTNYACAKMDGVVQAFIPLTDPKSPLDHTLTFYDDRDSLRNFRRFTYVSALERRYDVGNSTAVGMVSVNTRKTPGLNVGSICYEGKRDTAGASFWATMNVTFLTEDFKTVFTRGCAKNRNAFPWSQAQRFPLKVGYSKPNDFHPEITAVVSPHGRHALSSKAPNLSGYEIWNGLAYCLQESRSEGRKGKVRMAGIHPPIESLHHFCKEKRRRTERSISRSSNHPSRINDFKALTQHEKRLRPVTHHKTPEDTDEEKYPCPPYCINVFYDSTNQTAEGAGRSKAEPSDVSDDQEKRISSNKINLMEPTTETILAKNPRPQSTGEYMKGSSWNGYTGKNGLISENSKLSGIVSTCVNVCKPYSRSSRRIFRASGHALMNSSSLDPIFFEPMPVLVRIPRGYAVPSRGKANPRIYRPQTHPRFRPLSSYRGLNNPPRVYRASINHPRFLYRAPKENLQVPPLTWESPPPYYPELLMQSAAGMERYARQSLPDRRYPRLQESLMEEPNPNLEESIFSADNIKITIINRQGGSLDEDVSNGKYKT